MIILHVGFPKTASTALQLLFSRNAEAFARQGLLYPLLDQDLKQRSLKGLLVRRNRADLPPPVVSKKLERLQQIIRQYRGAAILLSCEELTNAQDFDVTPAGLAGLASYFKTLGRDVRVIAYVRNPVDYYLSRMQEKLKSSGGIIDPGQFKPLMSQSIDAFATALDTTPVVRLFDRRSMVGGSIVTDFFSLIADIVLISPFKLEDRQANESLSAEVMFLLDMLHSGPAGDAASAFSPEEAGLLWRKLGQIDRDLGAGVRPVLFRDAAEVALAAARPDMQSLEKLWGIRFPEHQALAIDCPLPPEARLVSVESIVPVDRARAFAIWRRLTRQMLSATQRAKTA